MAQIATYVTDALHTIVRVGDAAFKLWLTGANARIEFDSSDYLNYDRTANSLGVVIGGATCHTVSAAAASFVVPTTTLQDSQLPRLDFNRSGTAIWHVGGSGTAGDNSFNISLNALAPVVSIDTGNLTIATSGAVKATGGISSAGAVRATGTGMTGLNNAAAVELIYDGTAGTVQAYNRGTSTYSSIALAGLNVNLQPQGGVVSSAGNHNVQGFLSLGGAALGGISGQISFLDATGVGRANISWQGGNEYRIANSTNGSVTHYVNGTERFRITAAIVSSPGSIQAGNTGNGAVRLDNGAGSTSGAVAFLTTGGALAGYIQQALPAGDINYFNNTPGGHFFNGPYVGLRASSIGGLSLNVGSATLTGKFVMTDTIGSPTASVGGQMIGQPTAYSNTNGHRFDSYIHASGQVSGTTPGFGTSGGLVARGSGAGGAAIIQMTNNADTDEWVSIIADPAGNKITINVAHAPVFSIDSSGNVRALGTITPGVAP